MLESLLKNGTEGSGGFVNFIFRNKYYIFALVFIAILVYIAYYSENSSQEAEKEAFQNEMKRLETIQNSKTVPSPLELGNKFYQRFEKGSGNKYENYINAVKYYQQCAENNPQVSARLAKLLHVGLPETYDRNGNKVQGIPPNAEQAIYYYTRASQMGDGESLLALADIYNWGLHNFEPNQQYAKQLYLLLRKIGNDYQKGIAKDRILQMKEDDGTVIGSGIDAAGTPGGGASFAGEDSVGAGSGSLEFQGTFQNYGQNPLSENFDTDLDHSNAQVDELSQRLNIKHTANKMPINEKTDNNPHNVTDHVINNTIKQTTNALKAQTALIMDIPTVFRDIKRWILAQRGQDDKKKDALRTLNEISKSINQRNYDEHKEIDCLQLVWNRIHANINNANKNILKQNLFNELAECVEYGEVICRTGRIVRFFDALNFIDPLVKLKPKWALKEEMMEKAALLRDAALKRAPAHVRDAVNSPNPSPDQIQLIQKFEDRFRQDLVRTFEKDYVDSGRMSKQLLNTEINTWLGAGLV